MLNGINEKVASLIALYYIHNETCGAFFLRSKIISFKLNMINNMLTLNRDSTTLSARITHLITIDTYH